MLRCTLGQQERDVSAYFLIIQTVWLDNRQIEN